MAEVLSRKLGPRIKLFDRCHEWEVQPWRNCTGCGQPIRVVHKATGACATCFNAANAEEVNHG